MTPTNPHGLYQFDFNKLTIHEVANVMFFVTTKLTPSDVHVKIIDMTLRICNQFSGFTRDDFLFWDEDTKSYRIVNDEKENLIADIAFEFFYCFMDFFNLTASGILKNEFYTGSNVFVVDAETMEAAIANNNIDEQENDLGDDFSTDFDSFLDTLL